MKFKLFCIFFLLTEALLLSLGYWQYDRYQQKQGILAVSKQKMTDSSVPYKTVTKEDAYRHVLVTGVFDHSRSQLVAHQRRGGKSGYRLLTPFLIQKENTEVIVDRGFVPMQKLSPEIMDTFVEREQESAFGVVRFYESKQSMFKSPDTLMRDGVELLLRKDPALIKVKENTERLPYYIQLDYQTAEGLKAFVDQPRGTIPHFEYMMTWLTLAVLVLGLYAFLLRSKFLTLRTPKI